MKSSIFDSKPEEKLFHRFKSVWSRHVDIFPQLPVSKVAGYENIENQNISEKAKDFLKKTSFDFVICDPATHAPILVIEFDGLAGGVSRDGKYYADLKDVNDPHRELKMRRKPDLCEQQLIPMVVVSYAECDILKESEDLICVLDVIIGNSIENSEAGKKYGIYSQMLSEAYDFGGQPAVDYKLLEIEIMRDEMDPIKRKIKSITRKFPRWSYGFYFTQPDENGVLRQAFNLDCGLITRDQVTYTKRLLSVTVSIRQVGSILDEPVFLLNTLGEYCLAMKAKKELGYDPQKWKSAIEQAQWVLKR